MVEIKCSCGSTIKEYEDGVNDSDYYECECGKTYNVIEGHIDTNIPF